MTVSTRVTNEGLCVGGVSLAVLFLLTAGLYSCSHEDLPSMGVNQPHKTVPTVAAAPRPR